MYMYMYTYRSIPFYLCLSSYIFLPPFLSPFLPPSLPNVQSTLFNCQCSNFAEAARLILEYGADINSKDGRENTATMAAGALGHYEVLEVLLEHHLLNLHAGVKIQMCTCMFIIHVSNYGQILYLLYETSLLRQLFCITCTCTLRLGWALVCLRLVLHC